MGGANAGEVASRLSIETIRDHIRPIDFSQLDDEAIKDILQQALLAAHQAVLHHARQNTRTAGMGSTCTICLIYRDILHIAWVGDSRVYRYSKSGRVTAHHFHTEHLELLTSDHSLVWKEVMLGEITPEEARLSNISNIITQSIGDPNSIPSPDYRRFPLYQGDIILSSSDGLNSMLSDVGIHAIVDSYSEQIDLLPANLINGANQAGGRDNITVITCLVVDGPVYITQNALENTLTSIIPNQDLLATTKVSKPARNKKKGVIYLTIISLIVIGSWFFFLKDSGYISRELTLQDTLPEFPLDSGSRDGASEEIPLSEYHGSITDDQIGLSPVTNTEDKTTLPEEIKSASPSPFDQSISSKKTESHPKAGIESESSTTKKPTSTSKIDEPVKTRDTNSVIKPSTTGIPPNASQNGAGSKTSIPQEEAKDNTSEKNIEAFIDNQVQILKEKYHNYGSCESSQNAFDFLELFASDATHQNDFVRNKIKNNVPCQKYIEELKRKNDRSDYSFTVSNWQIKKMNKMTDENYSVIIFFTKTINGQFNDNDTRFIKKQQSLNGEINCTINQLKSSIKISNVQFFNEN
ncbi:MAG: protein phosphatase 2C domain-containing protein [Saprospiraceae bacterium]|nr:protein phosphatase 2C domain-containing protein [Saprospiraceae bacterium]